MDSTQPSPGKQRIFSAIAALLVWFSLILQLVLLLQKTELDLARGFLRYFSYFTILTNILLAFFFSNRALIKTGRNFLGSRSSATAICAYMLFVGLSYTLLLRKLWNPQGWQLIDDELLHTINPILILIFWFVYVKAEKFSWFDFLPWLIYPAVYLVYALLVSPVIGLYPYPFVDASRLTYQQIFVNGLALLGFFAFISLILIAIDRNLKTRYR